MKYLICLFLNPPFSHIKFLWERRKLTGRNKDASILQTTHLDPLKTQNLCLDLEKLETQKKKVVLCWKCWGKASVGM